MATSTNQRPLPRWNRSRARDARSLASRWAALSTVATVSVGPWVSRAGTLMSARLLLFACCLPAHDGEGNQDDDQGQHGGDGGPVADVQFLEEREVREVRRHVGGVLRSTPGQGVDRTEHLERCDGAGEGDDEGFRLDLRNGDRPEPGPVTR